MLFVSSCEKIEIGIYEEPKKKISIDSTKR